MEGALFTEVMGSAQDSPIEQAYEVRESGLPPTLLPSIIHPRYSNFFHLHHSQRHSVIWNNAIPTIDYNPLYSTFVHNPYYSDMKRTQENTNYTLSQGSYSRISNFSSLNSKDSSEDTLMGKFMFYFD